MGGSASRDPVPPGPSLDLFPTELQLLIFEHVAGLHRKGNACVTRADLEDLAALVQCSKKTLKISDAGWKLFTDLYDRFTPAPLRQVAQVPGCSVYIGGEVMLQAQKNKQEGRSARVAFFSALHERSKRQLLGRREVLWNPSAWGGGWGGTEGIDAIILHATEEEFVLSLLLSSRSRRPLLLVGRGVNLADSVSPRLLAAVDIVKSGDELGRHKGRALALHPSALEDEDPTGLDRAGLAQVSVIGLSSALVLAALDSADSSPLRRRLATWLLRLKDSIRPNGPYAIWCSFSEALHPRPFYALAPVLFFYSIGEGSGSQMSMLLGLAMFDGMARTTGRASGGAKRGDETKAYGRPTHSFVWLYVTANISSELVLCNEASALAVSTKKRE